jgi:hypothetical protein
MDASRCLFELVLGRPSMLHCAYLVIGTYLMAVSISSKACITCIPYNRLILTLGQHSKGIRTFKVGGGLHPPLPNARPAVHPVEARAAEMSDHALHLVWLALLELVQPQFRWRGRNQGNQGQVPTFLTTCAE